MYKSPRRIIPPWDYEYPRTFVGNPWPAITTIYDIIRNILYTTLYLRINYIWYEYMRTTTFCVNKIHFYFEFKFKILINFNSNCSSWKMYLYFLAVINTKKLSDTCPRISISPRIWQWEFDCRWIIVHLVAYSGLKIPWFLTPLEGINILGYLYPPDIKLGGSINTPCHFYKVCYKHRKLP